MSTKVTMATIPTLLKKLKGKPKRSRKNRASLINPRCRRAA